MDRVANEKLSGKNICLLVAAGTTISAGTMVAVNADGYAVPAYKTVGLTVAGCAMRYTDNISGADGEASVPTRRGVFVWGNDGSIEVTDVLKDAYVSDEKNVTINADGSSRVGKILAVDSDGVTVEML